VQSRDQHRSSRYSRPATRRSRSRSGSGRRRHDRSRSRSTDRSYRRHREHRNRDRRHRSRDRRHSPSRSPPKPKNFKEHLKEKLFSSTQQLTTAAATVTLSSSGLTATSTSATASAVALEARKLCTCINRSHQMHKMWTIVIDDPVVLVSISLCDCLSHERLFLLILQMATL